MFKSPPCVHQGSVERYVDRENTRFEDDIIYTFDRQWNALAKILICLFDISQSILLFLSHYLSTTLYVNSWRKNSIRIKKFGGKFSQLRHVQKSATSSLGSARRPLAKKRHLDKRTQKLGVNFIQHGARASDLIKFTDV